MRLIACVIASHIFFAVKQIFKDRVDRMSDVYWQVLSFWMILHVETLTTHDEIQQIKYKIFLQEIMSDSRVSIH